MASLEREQIKQEPVLFMVMGMRGDVPQWQIKTDRTQLLYKALYDSGIPILKVENQERVYLVYVRTDAEAAKVFRMVGTWPRTFHFKNKILKYLAKSPKELPPPVK